MPKIFTAGIFSEGGGEDFKQLCNRAEVSSELDKGRGGGSRNLSPLDPPLRHPTGQ